MNLRDEETHLCQLQRLRLAQTLCLRVRCLHCQSGNSCCTNSNTRWTVRISNNPGNAKSQVAPIETKKALLGKLSGEGHLPHKPGNPNSTWVWVIRWRPKLIISYNSRAVEMTQWLRALPSLTETWFQFPAPRFTGVYNSNTREVDAPFWPLWVLHVWTNRIPHIHISKNNIYLLTSI